MRGHDFKDEENLMREIDGITRKSQGQGLGGEEKNIRVVTENGECTFLTHKEKFLKDWSKQRSSEFTPLSCGTIETRVENMQQCAFSKEIISRSQAVICEECFRPVWKRYTSIVDGKIYCKSMAWKKRLWFWALVPFGRMIKTIVYGLCGTSTEETNRGFEQGVIDARTYPQSFTASEESPQSLQAWEGRRDIPR